MWLWEIDAAVIWRKAAATEWRLSPLGAGAFIRFSDFSGHLAIVAFCSFVTFETLIWSFYPNVSVTEKSQRCPAWLARLAWLAWCVIVHILQPSRLWTQMSSSPSLRCEEAVSLTRLQPSQGGPGGPRGGQRAQGGLGGARRARVQGFRGSHAMMKWAFGAGQVWVRLDLVDHSERPILFGIRTAPGLWLVERKSESD